MVDKQIAMTEKTAKETKALYQQQVDRWKRLWAATFFSLIIVLVLFLVIRNDLGNAADQRAEEIKQLREVVSRVIQQQNGIDVLVDFVKDVQAEEGEGPDLQIFVDLLCASSDPVRQEACERIKAEGISP